MVLGDLAVVIASLILAPMVAILDMYAGTLLSVYGFHWLICWSPSIISIAIPSFVLFYLNKGRWQRFIQSFSGSSYESRDSAMEWIVAEFSKKQKQQS